MPRAVADRLPNASYLQLDDLDHFGPMTHPGPGRRRHRRVALAASTRIVHCRAPLLYDGGMYPVPTSLSPSRVEAFTSCPMAFRFASIERLPESPSPHTTKGSTGPPGARAAVHPPSAGAHRSTRLTSASDRRSTSTRIDPEFTLLNLDETQQQAFVADAWSLVEAYFRMEDPTAIREIGLELRLEAQVGSLALRGIIDRLELDADGGLVVTDYKTGRAPGLKYEQSRLGRRALLLVPVRGGARSTAIGHPADVPAHRRDHHRLAVGAVGQVHHHPHHRGVEGSRARLHHRHLPAPPGPAVRVVLVPAVVPGVRRRPRAGRRRGAVATRRARRVSAVDIVRLTGATPSSSGCAATPLADPVFNTRQLSRRLQRDLAPDRHRSGDHRSVDLAAVGGDVGADRRREPHRQPRREAPVPPHRPTETGDPRFRVRRPSTSSFPSGHASAAFFAAAILTTATGRALAPVWYSAAVTVAISRAYVRIHHPSDVVGGAALGAALGVAGSRVFSMPGAPNRQQILTNSGIGLI